MALAVIFFPQDAGSDGLEDAVELDLLSLGYLKADYVATVLEVVDKPTKAVVSDHSAEDSDYFSLIAQYSWNPQIAYAVMMAESRGDSQALNNNPSTADYSVGLFQINLYGALADDRPSEEWLRIPANNITYAHTMWQQSGWYPWSVYKNGSYLQYLK